MELEYVIGVLALLFVLLAVFGVLAAVKTVRAVKRGIERTGQQVRRTVEETTLKARTAQPGPIGELARIRIELRSSIDTTRYALEAGVSADPSLSEALALMEQLRGHAQQLDGELRLLMDREPDRARIGARLPDVRRRAEAIQSSADSLRWAAQDRARQHDADGLAALHQQIEIEAGALRPWRDTDAVPPAEGRARAQAAEVPAPAPAEGDGRFGSGPPNVPAERKERPHSAS